MDDLINRAMAIEAVENALLAWSSMSSWREAKIVEAVADLPSAQPECDKEFVMLKVIDLNGSPYYSIIYLEDGREYEGYSSYDLMVISEYLKRYFGFAQPEHLTGKEKMIFLAAMAKEENICKQIDDEYRDCELYEDSLVRACQEIERKVRGALWT